MQRSAFLVGLFALLTQACDAGTSSSAPVMPDPASLERGDDTDLGIEDMGPTPVELHGQLHVTGSELRDSHDAKVQLKGVSSMWLNWEDDGYAESLEGLKWLRNNWHLSVIRAAMGVEPAGAYLTDPETAKKQVDQIVQNAIAAGVYVVIDWHDHDALEHQAQSVAFFSEIAAKYAGIPNVLYETFNEPLMVKWSTELKPYHQAVVSAIRAADPENVIVLGTPTWSQDVDKAAADPVEGKNLMYTLHFYSCTHSASLISKAKAAMGKGLAIFVTEWGATDADGGRDGIVCPEKAQVFLDWMRQDSIGWAAWKFDNCEPDSTCFLTPDAPTKGGWTNQYLRGQGPYLRARMQE